MKILIVEDEASIAEEIEEMTKSVLKNEIDTIDVIYTFNKAIKYLEENQVDLCLLDLNLNGKSGYDILKQTLVGPFHTIIVSAHIEQAVEAFHYGVLDFVPKPVNEKRLKEALDRYSDKTKSNNNTMKYVVVKKHNSNHIISVDEIIYFSAEGYLVRIHLENGKEELIEKPLNRLEQVLPGKFFRIHRSYIVDINRIESYKRKSNGVYELTLKNNQTLPVSPQKYKSLKTILAKS